MPAQMELSWDWIKSNDKAKLNKIKKLLKKGIKINYQVDINYQDEQGNSALHYAMQFSQPFLICKFLLEQGANVNLRNQQGYSPFLYFILHYHEYLSSVWKMDALFELLMEHGADINYCQKLEYPPNSKIYNNTLLHIAIYGLTKNYVPYPSGLYPPSTAQIVKNLLSLKQIDVNAQNSLGETALAVAAKTGYYIWLFDVNEDVLESTAHQKIIISLIKSGANLEISDSHGYTPLCLAMQHNVNNRYNGYATYYASYIAIPQLLIQYGANINPPLLKDLKLAQFFQITDPKILKRIKQLELVEHANPDKLSKRISTALQKIAQSQTPQRLNLSKHSFIQTKITLEEIINLMNIIEENTLITSINLSGNGEIDERCARAMAKMLLTNHTVREIIFDKSSFIRSGTLQQIEERLNRNQLHYLIGKIAGLLLKYARTFLQTLEANSPLQGLPLDLKKYILSFLDEKALLTEAQITNVTQYASDKATLNLSKENFLIQTGSHRVSFSEVKGITFFGRRKQYLIEDIPQLISENNSQRGLK